MSQEAKYLASLAVKHLDDAMYVEHERNKTRPYSQYEFYVDLRFVGEVTNKQAVADVFVEHLRMTEEEASRTVDMLIADAEEWCRVRGKKCNVDTAFALCQAIEAVGGDVLVDCRWTYTHSY